MEYQKLGHTDLSISRIGFGCWAIGGHGYGLVNDDTSILAVNKAIELGINFFDTADVYGFGHSEKILAKALGSQRHKVVIATKFGVNWDSSGKTFLDCSPKHLTEAVEASLRRLNIDCIPLYQVHKHDNKTPLEEIAGALQLCREAGKIQYIGCSNFSFPMMEKLAGLCNVQSTQVPLNVREFGDGEMWRQLSEKSGFSVLAYNVLMRGLLTGKYNKESKFEIADTRDRDENFGGDKLSSNLELVNDLGRIGADYGKSPSQVAIKWMLENKFVTCTVIGAKNAEQVEENAGVFNWSISEKDFVYLMEKGQTEYPNI